MSSLVCQHCGCNDIDTDPGRGDAVCTQCGSVLQDQLIVSEVQFAENAGGGASVMGQYVSTDGPKSMSLGGGFHHGMGKEWRQFTLENGRSKIQRLGAQLKLNQHCIDTAFNFFKMAVNRRLTQGRKTNYVIAACVYLVCRTEGTSHMLLDLSDVLQTDVHTLGRTYLQLSKELCIRIPVCDPCLYIQRFAHKLEFGDKTHEVSMTALRLVQRMKRDWMAQGRRPSGLCGAALLVAGRIHDFNRKIKDVMRVVKIGEGTIRKRLAEFEATPSSQLTIDEFQNIDLEEEMDPPCFTEGKRKAKLQQLEEQGQLGKITEEIAQLQKEIEKQLAKENEKRFRIYKNLNDSITTDSDCQSSGQATPDFVACSSGDIDSFLLQETLKDVVSDTELGSISASAKSFDIVSGSQVLDESSREVSSGSGDVGYSKSGMRPRPSVTSLGITSSIEDYMTLTEDKTNEAEEEEEEPEGCELDLSGIDDKELDYFILSEREVRIKTKIWMEANADYLRQQKEKREREAKEREEEANKPEHKKRKRARKHTSKQKEHSTAADAIKNMLQERKISSKINYDVLKDLNRSEETGANSGKDGTTSGESTQLLSPSAAITTFTNNHLKRPLDVLKTAHLAKRIKEEDVVKKEVIDENRISEKEPVIVESGPVQYHPPVELDEEDIENEDEEEEEEEQISAAQLLGHSQVDEDDEYIYDEVDLDD